MKQLIIIFLSTLGLLFSSIQAAGENPPTKTVPVKKEKKEKTDPDPEGRRAPSRIIYCTISTETGVEIPGVAKEEICSFEAYDDAGFCLAIFSDEGDFIDFFFENYETIGEVRFLTTDYVFIGYLANP